jgi:hypothetical protein
VGDTEAKLVRARRLAIAFKDAALDDEMRGDLVHWYTFGETRSTKDLDEKQADDLWKLAMKIRRGKADIRYDENGQLYVEELGKKMR